MDYAKHDRDMFRAYDERPPWYPESDDDLDEDQLALMEVMRNDFEGKAVLEVACGGGHWAQRVASFARYVVGVDSSSQRIEFAREKATGFANVEFHVGDAYQLESVPGSFEAAYAVAWFSHVPRSRYAEFLSQLHRRVGGSGAIVYLIDEAENDEDAFTRSDDADNFKRGILSDGSGFEIVDNAFTREDYMEIFSDYGRSVQAHVGDVFGWVRYEVA